MSDIDTEATSPFLNDKLSNILRSQIVSIAQGSESKKGKDILKQLDKNFIFLGVFNNQGVQGLTGFIKNKKSKEKLVFKVSVELDEGIKHENLITKELNKIRPFCPHFVGNLGMINIPVSNDFIDDPDNYSLFTISTDSFPCDVLFMEYVSGITFHKICKYMYSHKSLIISLLCQQLLSIQIAQNHIKFNHADLHTDNVLIREIDSNSLFLYRVSTKTGIKTYLLPTYGFYPVIIDMGSSYCKEVEGKPMYTTIDNYQNGLQPVIYDPINDVSHLLISTLYYLSDKAYVYDFLRTRILHTFRHIPIIDDRGWKKLPHNFMKKILGKIDDDCKDLSDEYKVWFSKSGDIIDCLNTLIILPWVKKERTDFTDVMKPFIEQLQLIYDIKNLPNKGTIFIYILRKICSLVNKYRSVYCDTPEYAIEQFKTEWTTEVKLILDNNVKNIPKNIDFETLFVFAIQIADRLSANYYNYIQDNLSNINNWYEKTIIKEPTDAVDLLLKNATPCFKVKKTDTVYLWDSINKNKRVFVIGDVLTDEDVDVLNDASIKNKGDVLCFFIENKLKTSQ